MVKVGITGGIGSGKTSVCKIFETLNIPVYYADDRAKELMVNNIVLIQKIKDLLGNEAYLTDGSLNRPHIAQLVFSDKELLQSLNEIVHPAVFKDSIDWHNSQKDIPYSLKEAALLFESGSYQFLDKVITVFAPKSVRIERVTKRDKVSIADVKARMDKQMPDEEKVRLADFVINNEENEALIPQIIRIHQTLIQLGKKNENQTTK